MNSMQQVGLARDPSAAVTLAQTEILAPIVLVLADLLIAGIDRLARAFGRR